MSTNHTMDLVQERVRELRAEGRLAGAGTSGRNPLTGLRRLARIATRH